MTALSLPFFSFFSLSSRTSEPMIDDAIQTTDAERRRFVSDMISAGACDSENGVQMLMSIYPSKF